MKDRYIVVKENDKFGYSVMSWKSEMGLTQFWHHYPIGPKHPAPAYDLKTARKLIRQHHKLRAGRGSPKTRLVVVGLKDGKIK